MIKLIAVDLDGTFLRDDQTYDQERFKKIFSKIKKDKIKFVVASVNQYSQVNSQFPNTLEISTIAENGAYILSGGNEISVSSIPAATVSQLLLLLKRIPKIDILITTKYCAFTDSKNLEAIKMANNFFKNLKGIYDLKEILGTEILKVTCLLSNKDNERYLTSLIKKNFGKNISVKSSRTGVLSLQPFHVCKATGLEKLGRLYGIEASQMIAFGNDKNDEEMLNYVGKSFAPINADKKICSIADKIIPSNNNDCVLQTLEDYAKNNWQYPY